MEPLTDILLQSWIVLQESAIYVLAGVLAAGLLKALLPGDLVARHLGRGRVSGVVKAAVLGAPLPLCSCGAAPAAAGLRSQGASKGATAAFLVATPETGPDSVAVTWSLLDPLMALVRPLAGVLSAVAAGLAVNLVDRKPAPGPVPEKVLEPLRCLPQDSDGVSCSCHSDAGARPTLAARLRSGLGYAFLDLLPDIGGWFLFGVLVAGALTALVPAGFIEAHLGSGLGAKLFMLAVGIPLYVCATSSTPIAAALALKGLSPGAALVFLLAGPATNAASLAVVGRVLGRTATLVYLAALGLAALGAGVLTDLLYSRLGLDTAAWIAGGAEQGPGWIMSIAAAALALYVIGLRLAPLPARRRPSGCTDESCGCGH